MHIESNAKNINELILARILGVSGKITKTKEFLDANIIPKTIRIQKNGHIKESMSFPTFKFTDIVKEEWEESELRTYLEPAKFLFVVFREDNNGDYILKKAFFWNIPLQDLEEVKKVWERTVHIIKEGVQIEFDGRVNRNNLPKQSENPVAHVRPHGKNSSDTYPLPDGRKMPKQCFWLNRSYIEQIIKTSL